MYRLILLFLIIGYCNVNAAALKPKQYTSDKRFKTWTFYPNTVYYFSGHYLNHTYIEFEEGESINSMSTPKVTSWQLIPSANRLFLKPVEDDADTTLTVMTNKRIYFFELHAEDAKNPFDYELTFFIKFKYPKNSQGSGGDEDTSVIQYSATSLPDLSHPENYNFNYTASGDQSITPIKMFDDGQFTYLQFRANGSLPAVFTVDSEGFEEVANFRVVGDYVIVEKVNYVFSLRSGPSTVCVFNEVLTKGIIGDK
jgi:type IV secretion system protein VirB9